MVVKSSFLASKNPPSGASVTGVASVRIMEPKNRLVGEGSVYWPAIPALIWFKIESSSGQYTSCFRITIIPSEELNLYSHVSPSPIFANCTSKPPFLD